MEFNEELRDMLFGQRDDQMNMTSIRVHVEDLMGRIDSVLECLMSTLPVQTKWKLGLDAYNLITIHLQKLFQSTKPSMRHYIVCPVNYDPNFQSMMDVLATQLHQEQEHLDRSITEEMKRDDEELSQAIERIDERNDLIMDLIQVSRKPGSGLLDPKGPNRKRRLATSAEIRQEIRQFNEKHQWQTTTQRSKQPKRMTITPPDSASGFGVMTNALLFGTQLNAPDEMT